MANLSAERFAHPSAPRPPIQTHTSNSVPSTPFQQPREIRFPSRSPSPHRGLSNQSPRSVVSEAVGQQPGPRRGAPVVCKFESGAEIRKRRIPYVENGDKELEPPKEEPKKALTPHEEDKLSGDMRELYDRLLPSEESEQRRAELVKKLEKMLNHEWPGNDIKVNVFGSSGNLLSSSDSDVDICITTPLKQLESMHSLAMLLDKNGMERIVCRASAKVPIVKCWDPKLNMHCDINVNNPLALVNTRMIKTYVQLDPRVRPLAKIIKHWSKRRLLNDAAFGGTISSYTWTCMIISFLQRRNPRILPSLQKERDNMLTPESEFADDVEALKGCGDANKETQAQLLFHFFRHYGYEFKYSEHVVSVREGRLVTRKEKKWDYSNHWDKEAQKRLCVEEPFTTNRNLGNSADEYSWSGVHSEIRRAFDLLADGQQLEKVCQQYEFPPEEKTNRENMFQKPVPRPAPILRRSASQSGRANNHEQGSSQRSRKNNRNNSAQRAGNRRASSGAAYSHQRGAFGIASPPMAGNTVDYFQGRGNLHDQLYQQYQYLQQQQDLLRSQLVHQQQQQAQAQGRAVSDSIGSPPHRGSHTNGAPSPRYQDSPQTAPLLPGYLYHYPARYPPPPSPMQPSRSREGTVTNPSSPSLVPAVPALRRQVHRGSITEGTNGSIRSQSQPGRSLPHPLMQAQPNFDLHAIHAQYQQLRYAQAHAGLQSMFSPALATAHPTGLSAENAMPKEYMGYLVGQSPLLGPQQIATAPAQMPTMTLRDPPAQRQRRITPDLMPPLPNGRHTSRSPSPLGHVRSYSTTNDVRSRAQSQADLIQDPAPHDALTPDPAAPPSRVDTGGPLIVNGSTPSVSALSTEQANATPGPPAENRLVNGIHSPDQPATSQPLPLRTTNLDFPEFEEPAELGERLPSPVVSPSPRTKAGPRLALPNGVSSMPDGRTESYHEPQHKVHNAHVGPLLSPVAELRTPSPTRVHAFDKQESPQANGFVKAAKITNARQWDRVELQHGDASVSGSSHERKGSAPNPTLNPKLSRSPTALSPAGAGTTHMSAGKENQWQQATRKGHKKSKSSVGAGSGRGQPMPANEADRKGG
ncbi:Cid1 family poly A polymerase [Teratosphaeria destructans]|uniref:polynucleotide adenylyltransferase n=1 Tax=Teratosphaeria destructans TaxID=418781 RepID=A0A9W7SRX8_9PEZI|nr:Cid1 family poly A polymerase [Teratosphaeria destructans]